MDDISDHIVKILTILPAIFIVLSIHELGHYLIAKLFGVHADEYSLGYGKKIYARELKSKTSLIIRLFPIAAHVHLKKEEYAKVSAWKKSLIILAGPFFNFALIFPLFFIFFALAGQPSTPPVFAGIEINGVADQNDLKTNDRILQANGREITRYEEIVELTKEPSDEPIKFAIQTDGNIRNLSIRPEIISYIDIHGLKQHHGRLGVLARHAPYDLKSIHAVNGQKIPNDDRDAARNLIIQHLGEFATLSFKSADGTVRDFRTFLDEELNSDLLKPKKKDYDNFYVGMIGNNFYKELSIAQAASEAFIQSKDILLGILKIPVQLFPLDKEEFKPDQTTKGTPIKNWIYKFIFFIAVISIVIGFVNLIPLPHFDGGQLILLAAENINEKTAEPRYKAMIIVSSLLSLYAVIALLNYTDFKTFTHQKFCTSPEWEDKKEC